MDSSSATTRSPINDTRRALMLGAAGATLAQVAGCGGGMTFATAQPPLDDRDAFPTAERALPIVPLDPGVVSGTGVRMFSLAVQRGASQFRNGVDTRTLGYNGALLGPALRLHSGEKATIRVQNDLDEATTVHWHGLIVPAAMDGGPHQSIAPGARWSATFTIENPASTCWFHPHLHWATGRQVVMGLAGLLIVDDPATSRSTLPGDWGIDDLALVFQDKRFTASGQIDYALTASDRQLGYAGDSLLVNGAISPVWQAPRQWVRLRLLNGCNARSLSLRIGKSASLLQVANEGGLLAAPIARASVTLAPGERVEVLVDFSDAASGEEVPLYARTISSDIGMGMGGSTASEVTALRIRVQLPRQVSAVASPPSTLVAAPTLVARAGATVRSFHLEGDMMGGPFTINGRAFDLNRIDLTVPANTVEVWQFINASGMAHPMHVHGVRMSLLARGGGRPAAYELGMRDTFIVEPMQTVTVAVQTAAIASSSPLMFHCHILEHEDAGMMGQFITI